jgi:hypothetical protein
MELLLEDVRLVWAGYFLGIDLGRLRLACPVYRNDDEKNGKDKIGDEKQSHSTVRPFNPRTEDKQYVAGKKEEEKAENYVGFDGHKISLILSYTKENGVY